MKGLLKVALFLLIASGLCWFAFYKTPQERAFARSLSAAQQGNVSAMVEVGDFYKQGNGVPADKDQAVLWYRKSLQAEAPEAAWKLAQVEMEEKNWEEALAYLQIAAKEGSAVAQNELGRFYDEGLGVSVHHGQALYWRILAAQNGDAFAKKQIQQAQEQDPVFYKQEQEFLNDLQAAQAGNSQAMLSVAQAYYTGIVVVADFQEAERWFLKAWNEKIPQAGYELARWYLQPDSPLFSEEKGLLLLAELAALPYAPAQYMLGERAYQEDPPNYKDAYAWFSNAASNGDAKAQYMTGFMLMQGLGMTRSVPLAIQFFTQAARQEDPSAQYVLGQIYYKGLGVTVNKNTGKNWLQRAAANGSVPARAFLEEISK